MNPYRRYDSVGLPAPPVKTIKAGNPPVHKKRDGKFDFRRK